MSSQKPFKTIDEQLDTLEGRGVEIENRDLAASFLLRNNYYAVVNGYKEFFLDEDRCNEDVEVYREGTRFVDLTTLFSFDTILRFSMMHSLTTAERALKTATVHAFCERNRGAEDYLDPACYCPKSRYSGKNYTQNLIGLLSTLQRARDGRGERREYVEHYRRKYGEVPLWVLSNALTFGNMSHFYDLQRVGVQNETCRLICETTGAKSMRARRLREIYSTLTTFRNICAHGGRLFCARAGRRGDKRFSDMLEALRDVLLPYEQVLVENQVLSSLAALDDAPAIRQVVMGEMGLSADDIESMR